MNTTTDLGNEVRAEVKAILAKYSGTHEAIAGVRVDTLRKIDRFINPEPEGFEINTRRNNGILDFNANLERVKKVTADEELLFETEGVLTLAGIREGVGQ